jgi:hypothetical protein
MCHIQAAEVSHTGSGGKERQTDGHRGRERREWRRGEDGLIKFMAGSP